jgi:hypothetical protein
MPGDIAEKLLALIDLERVQNNNARELLRNLGDDDSTPRAG